MSFLHHLSTGYLANDVVSLAELFSGHWKIIRTPPSRSSRFCGSFVLSDFVVTPQEAEIARVASAAPSLLFGFVTPQEAEIARVASAAPLLLFGFATPQEAEIARVASAAPSLLSDFIASQEAKGSHGRFFGSLVAARLRLLRGCPTWLLRLHSRCSTSWLRRRRPVGFRASAVPHSAFPPVRDFESSPLQSAHTSLIGISVESYQFCKLVDFFVILMMGDSNTVVASNPLEHNEQEPIDNDVEFDSDEYDNVDAGEIGDGTVRN
ncbi:hypothetical protein M5K25_017958 [Dendrobium thyrsiflorum]|uniref:Uncharacterized protein n=1 Tax=Dendrobium thyrsiflorum TaxID=117978 RepID=A0ABD0UGY1_DENTH